jgi:hypothetical protein
MSVIDEIAAERVRQIGKEGWTAEHDDEHETGEMAVAAALYAIGPVGQDAIVVPIAPNWRAETLLARLWPWSFDWWKPKTRRRDLIRAAALIVAEIERLDRRRVGGAGTLSRDNLTTKGE